MIRRQAAAFEDAKSRLPDLARLVSEKDWVFTRNLLHGPMQEVSRKCFTSISASTRASEGSHQGGPLLKEALADLDEAARLQDFSRLQKSYSAVAAGFDAYSDLIPAEAFN